MTAPHGMEPRPRHDAQPWPSGHRPDGYPTAGENREQHHGTEGHPSHGGHGLMMLVCCIPMILLTLGLVATGAAGSGAIVGALLCTAMMAVMMRAMSGSHGHR